MQGTYLKFLSKHSNIAAILVVVPRIVPDLLSLLFQSSPALEIGYACRTTSTMVTAHPFL